MPPSNTPISRKRRILKRWAWGFAWVVTLLVLTVITVNWTGARAWNAQVREATAAGKSLDPASLYKPSVPDELNIATAPVFAPLRVKSSPLPEGNSPSILDVKTYLTVTQPAWVMGLEWKWTNGEVTDLGFWQQHYRDGAKVSSTSNLAEQSPAWRDFFVRTREYWNAPPRSPEEDVLFALSAYDEIMDQIAEAVESRPHCNLRVLGTAQQPYPRLIFSRYVPATFALRASAKLALSKPDEAQQDVRVILRFGEVSKDEPIFLGLLRGSSSNFALQVIWEGMIQHQWQDGALVKFDQGLAEYDFVTHYSLMAQGEKLFRISEIDRLRSDPQKFEDDRSGPGITKFPLWWQVAVRIVPHGCYDHLKVQLAKENPSYLACVDPKRGRIFPELAGDDEWRFPKYTPVWWLAWTGYGFPSFLNLSKRMAWFQDNVHLGRIAIALERHFLSHGAYPENLEGIDEAFKLEGGFPPDVASGNPPHYRRSGDRFVLYYDGWNCRDDNGKAEIQQSVDLADWVWPAPPSDS